MFQETSEQDLKPLRYNPGLKCDPELEAMRPERQSKHTAMPTGDWKKYLIKTQPSYEGSFADADIQKFRPNPTPSAMEDPWFVSQLPGQSMCLAPAAYSSYAAPYPSDQLHQIKMRNRRFQQSCALESSGGHRAQPAQGALAEDMMMMTNMAYSDLQRQVQMFQTLPAAPLPPTRWEYLYIITPILHHNTFQTPIRCSLAIMQKSYLQHMETHKHYI